MKQRPQVKDRRTVAQRCVAPRQSSRKVFVQYVDATPCHTCRAAWLSRGLLALRHPSALPHDVRPSTINKRCVASTSHVCHSTVAVTATAGPCRWGLHSGILHLHAGVACKTRNSAARLNMRAQEAADRRPVPYAARAPALSCSRATPTGPAAGGSPGAPMALCWLPKTRPSEGTAALGRAPFNNRNRLG